MFVCIVMDYYKLGESYKEEPFIIKLIYFALTFFCILEVIITSK